MIVVTGRLEQKPSEGHQLYIKNKLKFLKSKKHELTIICDGSNGDYSLYKSPFITRLYLFIRFLFPWQSTIYGNNKNLKLLKELDKDIAFFYFPETSLLSYRYKKIESFHFPDLHSFYYYQLYYQDKSIKNLIKSIIYKRAENKILNISKRNLFLGLSDIKIINKENVFLTSFELNIELRSTINNNLKDFIFFRPQEELLSWIENLPDFIKMKFTLVSKSNVLKNIKTEHWVNDYNTFVSDFKFQILFDKAGSGSSTKIEYCFQRGIIPLGNFVAFRNYISIGIKYNLIYSNEIQFNEVVNRLSNLSNLEYSSLVKSICNDYNILKKNKFIS